MEFVKIPGEWNSRRHIRNPPPRVEEILDSKIAVEIPGEWNSRRHKRNPPPRVEEILDSRRIEFAATQTKPASAG